MLVGEFYLKRENQTSCFPYFQVLMLIIIIIMITIIITIISVLQSEFIKENFITVIRPNVPKFCLLSNKTC